MTLALLAATGLAAPMSAQQARPERDDSTAQAMSCSMGAMTSIMGMMGNMRRGGNTMMGGHAMTGGGGMMGEGMTMMPAGRVMMDAMRFMPWRVPAIGDSLGLSQDQVTQIEALRSTGGMMTHVQSDTAADAALEQAFNAEQPDADAVRQAAERALQQRLHVQAGHVAAAAAVRGILAREQRERVTALTGYPMSGRGMHGAPTNAA